MDFIIDIASPPERVFAVLADLPNYPRWLPPSGLYATTEVSQTPVTLGTTYTDHARQAPLRGSVTRFDPPRDLAFHQEARTPFGRLIVDIDYQLAARGAGTHLQRTTAPRYTGLLALLGPLLTRSIRKENLRTLALLKQHLEAS